MTSLEIETYDLAYVAAKTGAPSVRWIQDLLRAGVIPGKKSGRKWRMSESDIAALVDYMAKLARDSVARNGGSTGAYLPAAPDPEPQPAPIRPGGGVGLTARARRNLQRSA
ncbi:helix-turn-helix domain-containing protein [Nocardia sp. NPDC004711]